MIGDLDAFRDAIRSSGLTPPDTIEPGRFLRFPGNGKANGNTAGWCMLFPDGRGGIFGDFATGYVETWQAKHDRPLSLVEREAYRRNVEATKIAAKAEREREHADAAHRAAERWQAAKPADPAHPYLVAKGVKPYGIRQEGNRLVIPVRDASGELHSVQFIGPDGGKKFLPGGRVAGCYFAIGKPSGTLCIAEGYATGASLHEVAGHAVAVAFNAGNLEPAAVALRAKYPELGIIICADDDYRTEGNPGITKATKAALAVGGLLAIPDFGDDRPDDASDFNDLRRHAGAEAVARCVANARKPDVSERRPVAPNAPQGRVWDTPRPIRASLAAVPAFAADALLPEPLRTWVSDEADRMPCAPDFLAAALLVGLGSVIGARCAIRPKARDSWPIVPNLWGGIVALPSAKKSPAMEAALKPIDRLAAKAAEAYRAELEGFEIDATFHKARREAIDDAIKRAAKKPGANVNAHADELRAHKASAPKPPTMRRYQTNDTTVEKVGELLRDNPAGLLMRRDELVGLFASWDREGHEADRAFYLESWNGTGSFNTDRIGRGSIAIPNLCVSIFGGIQPDKLTAYLEQAAHALANDGLLQRLQMLVYPDPTPWEWRDRAPNRTAREAVFAIFDALADFDPVQWGATPDDKGRPYFRFAEGAQAVFIEWMHDLYRERIPREQSDGHPLIAQHLAKYDKLFPALALILHLAECAATGQRGPVSEVAALRAAAWCEFLEAHARRCYGLMLDGGQRAAAMLASRIERGALADGFTARDVRRKGWRHLGTDAAVNAALEWLEGEDWIQAIAPTPGEAGGRRTLRYLVNPEILKMAGQPTAKTDETLVSAVMAVPHPTVSENSEAVHG